jgi:hypothetical protein
MQNATVPPDRRLDTKIMDAWRDAAKELGIRVEIPFTLTASDGRTEVYEGRVVDFGGPNGMVFSALNEDKESWQRRKEAGYFWSDLSPEYQSYDKDLFVATLDDWKWFGEKGREPAWYSGKNWS